MNKNELGIEERALITTDGEIVADFQKELYDILVTKRELDKQIESFKESLKKVMSENMVYKVKSDLVNITYTPETTREDLNKTKLKKEHPDLYVKYVKIGKVKPGLRIKLKDEDNDEND